jgi:uncharacterized protein YjdB
VEGSSVIFKRPLSRFATLIGVTAAVALATASCEKPITGPSKPVASVEVTPASAGITAGQTVPLTATLKDRKGKTLSGPAVSWSSSNTAVATVDANGVVLAVAAGPATITATSEGQSGTAAITVTALAIASVQVTPASGSIEVGQTLQLTATPKDAGGNPLSGRTVTWSSNNTAVATVDANGVVSGVTAGPATITATSESKSGTAEITVTELPVASVDVQPTSWSLEIGQTIQLTATPKDGSGNPLSGRAVAWSSGNTAVATVDADGIVTGVGAGIALIVAESEGQSGTAEITVTEAAVSSVEITPSALNIEVGQTAQLTATPRDASGNALSGRTVFWSSSNTAVATVDQTGLVTGMGAGMAVIVAESEGASGAILVEVIDAPVASVEVTPASANVDVTHTTQLSATLRDAQGNILSGRTVTWSSSNPSVATVNASGWVTGKAEGPVTITATSEAQSGTAAITVTPHDHH